MVKIVGVMDHLRPRRGRPPTYTPSETGFAYYLFEQLEKLSNKHNEARKGLHADSLSWIDVVHPEVQKALETGDSADVSASLRAQKAAKRVLEEHWFDVPGELKKRFVGHYKVRVHRARKETQGKAKRSVLISGSVVERIDTYRREMTRDEFITYAVERLIRENASKGER